MAKYTFTCTDKDNKHEPMPFTVEAADDDEGVMKMIDELKPHLSEYHTEMEGMSEEDTKKFIMDNWEKAEE